ncbi:MAG: enoyl-CoA hydratase [Desulfobacterales bacterium]|jgi:enoyl-CoA hydratase/carnithine racemase
MSDLITNNEIIAEKHEHILRIKINRPHKKNALTIAMYAAMADAIEKAEADRQTRVIFLQGTADCFTAGNDLQDFKNYSTNDEARPANPFLVAIRRAKKPMVAAVAGVAVGIGTTMLLHFDLTYAGESAQFRLPFVNLGLCPEAASSFLLPRLIGHQQASELLLLGEPFSAAKAHEIGLINAVCPDPEVIDTAYTQAQKLAQQPPASVRLTKALLKRSIYKITADTMAEEMKHFTERLNSPECAEALSAFFERRPPDFSQFD